ncbi:MAG: nicotinate-nucleotide adenylyltransferase [Bacteroidetes bacterium]|nr:MAG: nicotinate-nucleotide adenylyltransferase [Bacteroidota bacterium]
MNNKKIGLFFGTFNPIHVGHLIIANYMAEFTSLDKVWLVVSPQNPLKQKKSLLADYHRLAMARIAVEDNPHIQVSDIEFKLPKPSYTIHTIVYLKEKYPDKSFVLIMGEDNLRSFHKWKNHEELLKQVEIYVYPRALTEQEKKETEKFSDNTFISHPKVQYFEDVPVMKLSASFIREAIKKGKDVRYLLTEPVYEYVKEMHFYEK